MHGNDDGMMAEDGVGKKKLLLFKLAVKAHIANEQVAG